MQFSVSDHTAANRSAVVDDSESSGRECIPFRNNATVVPDLFLTLSTIHRWYRVSEKNTYNRSSGLRIEAAQSSTSRNSKRRIPHGAEPVFAQLVSFNPK